MKHLIDKDALVAEIEKLIRKNELYLDDNVSDAVRFQKTGAYSVLCDLRYFLNTLEVKEVDLDKKAGTNAKEAIAWLKKQDEEKSTEWSEEDKIILNGCIHAFEKLSEEVNDEDQQIAKDLRSCYRKNINWLKSLRPQNH
jgi:hypothetical protein